MEGYKMKNPNVMIDLSRLFGFDILVDEVSSGVDFQDETIAMKLGAKVGKPPAAVAGTGGED
jgi:hypothetical protein